MMYKTNTPQLVKADEGRHAIAIRDTKKVVS